MLPHTRRFKHSLVFLKDGIQVIQVIQGQSSVIYLRAHETLAFLLLVCLIKDMRLIFKDI